MQKRWSSPSGEPGGRRSSWSSKMGVTSRPSRRRSTRRSGRRLKLNLWSRRGRLKLGTSKRPSQGKRMLPHYASHQRMLYKCFGGVQTAVVRLTEADARSLLGLGRLRVGWVNCRMLEHVEFAECSRFHGYGHVWRGCVLPFRRDACWRCGGRVARDQGVQSSPSVPDLR